MKTSKFVKAKVGSLPGIFPEDNITVVTSVDVTDQAVKAYIKAKAKCGKTAMSRFSVKVIKMKRSVYEKNFEKVTEEEKVEYIDVKIGMFTTDQGNPFIIAVSPDVSDTVVREYLENQAKQKTCDKVKFEVFPLKITKTAYDDLFTILPAV